MKWILAAGLYLSLFFGFILLDRLLNKLGIWKMCYKALEETAKFIGDLLFDEKKRGIAIFIWMIVSLFLSGFIYRKYVQ